MRTERATQERVFRALKTDLFAGVYVVHARIDLKLVSERYHASRTPVREAIFRLVGEKLLTSHPDGGFQISVPDATRLSDLYFWNAQHLLAAIHVSPENGLRKQLRSFGEIAISTDPLGQVTQMAAFCLAIAGATANVEFAERTTMANEWLHFPRLAETFVFGDSVRELGSLFSFTESEFQKNLRRRILAYHRRRIEHVSRISAMWPTRDR